MISEIFFKFIIFIINIELLPKRKITAFSIRTIKQDSLIKERKLKNKVVLIQKH